VGKLFNWWLIKIDLETFEWKFRNVFFQLIHDTFWQISLTCGICMLMHRNSTYNMGPSQCNLGRSQAYDRELQRQRCKKSSPRVAECILKTEIFSCPQKNVLFYYNAGVAPSCNFKSRRIGSRIINALLQNVS
jgi:hypothetical protein